jgi:hypothetical protein
MGMGAFGRGAFLESRGKFQCETVLRLGDTSSRRELLLSESHINTDSATRDRRQTVEAPTRLELQGGRLGLQTASHSSEPDAARVRARRSKRRVFT